jgi:hypothetical protein
MGQQEKTIELNHRRMAKIADRISDLMIQICDDPELYPDEDASVRALEIATATIDNVGAMFSGVIMVTSPTNKKGVHDALVHHFLNMSARSAGAITRRFLEEAGGI